MLPERSLEDLFKITFYIWWWRWKRSCVYKCKQLHLTAHTQVHVLFLYHRALGHLHAHIQYLNIWIILLKLYLGSGSKTTSRNFEHFLTPSPIVILRIIWTAPSGKWKVLQTLVTKIFLMHCLLFQCSGRNKKRMIFK